MPRALTSLFCSTLSLATFGCLIPLTVDAQIPASRLRLRALIVILPPSVPLTSTSAALLRSYAEVQIPWQVLLLLSVSQP